MSPRLATLAAPLLGLLLAGCATAPPRDAVPPALASVARPVGFSGVRFWGDRNDPAFVERLLLERARTLDARFGDAIAAGERPALEYLALSGGGQYGAFAAGLLNGWTESGLRPRFDVVSGISTGAIIAPFAFLGPDHDAVLRDLYTTTRTEDMLEPRLLAGLFGGNALADSAPLRRRIAEHVTPDLLAAIAAEHRGGRLLFVGTTNLDMGRPVIWNMGAIAASGHPRALALFRDVILASAAIPIAFPPVFFEVEAEGAIYEEMHVDGGVTSQVSILSPQVPGFLMDDLLGFTLDRRLHVVLNGAVTPPPKAVEGGLAAIGAASLETVWYAQAVGDLFRIHDVARRDGVPVRFAWIPEDFTAEPEEPFDPAFMTALFELGRARGREGVAWSPVPPNYTAPGTAAVERGRRPLPSLDG